MQKKRNHIQKHKQDKKYWETNRWHLELWCFWALVLKIYSNQKLPLAVGHFLTCLNCLTCLNQVSLHKTKRPSFLCSYQRGGKAVTQEEERGTVRIGLKEQNQEENKALNPIWSQTGEMMPFFRLYHIS